MTLAAFLRHLAFVASLALVSALVVAAMISARVMDVPNARSAHARPTPKGGGVGIVVAFMLGITVLYGYADFSRLADPYFRGVILAALAIAVVAFLDDLKDWPFVVKLAAQALAALAAAGSGLYVRVLNLPYIGPVDLGWLGFALSLGWVVFATNAMNFIDGMNGLAAGTALVASLFLAWLAAAQGAWFVYFAALLLAAGLAGFLPFNFPRARIFMGDVGSQFCGFILAVLGIAAARFETVEMSFLLVPCLLSGVLFDVAFTLARRALAGQRLTEAHRGHLYQVAQRAGMDARFVAALYWGFAALGGVVCLVFVAAPSRFKPLLPPLLLVPQLVWLAAVAHRARRAGIARW
jgi:UDP-GlcNAc:undecaprenyl-phosphate GlcNAc-1-phosphate transferase